MCDHEDFAAFVDVSRLTRSDDDPTVIGYTAEVRIDCAHCGEAFLFRGVPVGMLPDQPAMSPDRVEIRLPIAPRSADPSFGLDIPGFRVTAHVERPSLYENPSEN